jgi:copper chaperone CopZ
MQSATIDIRGMTCQGCVASVTRVLSALPGVRDVKVALDPGSATVNYDPARTDIPAMTKAIEEAGYDVVS